MSGPEFLTPRERQLLAAVRELVSLPEPASYLSRQRYFDELAQRAAWLTGWLRDDDEVPLDRHGAAFIVDGIRVRAARPLLYKPEQAAPVTVSFPNAKISSNG